VLSTYENNGLLYGALLGALVGALIAGPHFSDWAIEKILAAIAVSSAVIGATGHFAVWIIYAAVSEGPRPYDASEEQDSSSTDGVHATED
jgi:hypothetical protein